MASIDVDVAPGALVLTVEEAAQVMRCGRTFAYQQARLYLDTGGVAGIPVVQIGGCFRVPRWALLELALAGRLVGLCDAEVPAVGVDDVG